jgi:hypothetical protein
MKRSQVILMAGIFAVLALWLGCSLGYHLGSQSERKAWEATRVTAIYRDDAPPSESGNLTILGPTDKLKLDRHDRIRWYYTNPRSGVTVSGPWRHVENRPDPRTMLVQ